MGRKKPTARDDENPQQAAGAKSKKKTLVIEDDEYSIGTELSEESQAQEEKVAVTGKKGKKGNSKASKRRDDDDFDDLGKGDEGEDEVLQVAFTGKKKGKSKKSGGNSVFSSSSFGLLGDEDVDDDEKSGLTGDDDEDAPVVSFSGKKKASKSSKKTGGSLFTGSAFDAIGDEDDSDGEVVDSSVDKSKEDDDSENEDEPVISFTGKKKPSKGGKKGGNVFAAASFDALDDADEEKDEKNHEDDEVPQITFSGKKKKSSKVSKKSGASSLSSALLDEGNDQDTSVSEPTRVGDDTVDHEDASVIAFTGKKKPSKKKGNGVLTALSEDTDVFQPEQPNTETSKSEADDSKTNKSKEVLETSKSKKKKKKSGRTAQEEDDLDKILAELGDGPTTSKPAEATVQAEKVEVQPDLVAPVDASGEKEGEEETGESAAAKKKRKKKEKEKEKKAAAAAAAGTATAPVVTKDDKQEETQIEPTDPKKKEVKGKVADKKLPKHVREMQEALARRQELEERLKREAEEKQRKEEEERRKQEELEREKEAARILRKEREKEKLQRKRQEGKILTPKQKEEQRRREAMRNQILANAGGLPLPTADNEKKAKRPMYQKKKTKAAPIHENGAASAKPVENLEEGGQQDTIPEPESGEFEKVEDVESVDLEEKSEVAESVKENGVEEEEEEEEEEEDDNDDDDPWDVKSFDDVNLSVKRGFSDEEIDSQPVAKKDIKSAGAKPSVSALKTVPSQPIKSQDGENKKKQPDNDVDKSKKKDVSVKKAAATSNAGHKESGDNLRSPICCIMGHVDTGKTKLLDCIRGTNVQEGEAGGITQQIGATYFPAENIRERTKELKADAKLKVPGLLVIDTPGHESFTNLRSRGSGLCDIAILVVDIMHGLEPQTIESLNLLKMRNTEFIVALNKVDRLYGWKTCRNAPIVKAMKQQSKDVQNEFNMRLVQIITQFKEQGLNTELYYKNKEMGETYSIIPTSAISGEGIPDLLLLLVQWTQKTMVEKLTFSNEIQCTVLEVKVIEGLGTTIDVVLVNGVLHEGDQIVVCGMQGPIVATIRSLLTPHPMKELRVKGAYLHHSQIKAAQGIKISAQGLEHAIAGTALHVVGPHDDLDEIKETAMEDMKSVLNRIDKSGEGVCVQASTLGSLEALLEFLKTPVVNIPVSGISIGPVHKKDVMKASVMLEKKKEFATILAFDVKVTPEAREMADDLGVKIFIADIIYHLFDQFKAYIENIKEEKKKESADEAVFPCVLKIMPNCVFNKKDPIILGVEVLDGILKVGTPICIPQRDFISIGRIASIENNHKPVDTAKKGSKLAIKIIGSNSEEQQKMFGRHFEIDDELVSQISRNSIDVLKANYRDELSMEEWKLLVKLKKLFEIP